MTPSPLATTASPVDLMTLRQRQGLTKVQLARMAGLTYGTLNGIERGTSPHCANEGSAERIAKVLGVPVGAIAFPKGVSHLGRPAGSKNSATKRLRKETICPDCRTVVPCFCD